MGASSEELLKTIRYYQESIDKYASNKNSHKLLSVIEKLKKLPIATLHLEDTGIGRTVNALRKLGGDVGDAAKGLVAKWKEMVVQEEVKAKEEAIDESANASYSSENEAENYEEGENSCGETSQRDKDNTTSHRSSDIDKKNSEKHRKVDKYSSKSSHDKRDGHRDKKSSNKKRRQESDSSSEDQSSKRRHNSSSSESEEEVLERKDSKSKRRHHSESSEEEQLEKKNKLKKSKHSRDSSDSEESYRRHKSKSSKSGSSSGKSKSSRKTDTKSQDDDSSSDREDSRSKHGSGAKIKRDSDFEVKSNSKHKSRKNEESTSDNEEKHKSKHDSKLRNEKESSKSKHHSEKKDKKDGKREESKDKHNRKKDESRKQEEKNKKVKEENGKRESDKSNSSKHKSTSEKRNKEKVKPVNPEKIVNGIDSGSGASFAEALGMCGTVSTKTTSTVTSSKKKSSSLPSTEKPRSSSSSYVKPVVAPEQEEEYVPTLLKDMPSEPLNINISSLLPEITPHYRPLGFPIDSQPKRMLTQDEALSQAISNKNMRTKVYSGNKSHGKVDSLFELCVRILQDNIDALEYTGGVPFSILKPVLDKATPDQLFNMEHHNPYLIEDTDYLWQLHCQKEFRNKKREELESWREMYMRCLDEREARLNAITANIKHSQDKSIPVRTTKLAYIDSVVKPPRNVLKKQAKNGIVFDKKPAQTPSSRLAALTASGDVAKVAVPNPGSRSSSSSSAAAMKPKKAPLMAKTLSLFKNRFRR